MSEEGSLELLLDTICNTFGSLMFVTILVVTLADLSRPAVVAKPAHESLQRELKELKRELAKREFELEAAENAITLRNDIEASVIDRQNFEIVEVLKRRELELNGLIRANSNVAEEISTIQTSINELVDRNRELVDTLDAKRVELQVAELRLREERSARTRVADLPVDRPWEGQLNGCFVDASTFCIVETGQVEVVDTGFGERVVRPKHSAGLRIRIDPVNEDEIRRKLKGYDPTTVAFQIFVRTDSFAEFNAIRAVLVELGFNYQLEVLSVGEDVVLGDGRRSNRVQ